MALPALCSPVGTKRGGRRQVSVAKVRFQSSACREHQAGLKPCVICVNLWLNIIEFSAPSAYSAVKQNQRNLRQIFNQKRSYLPAKIRKSKVFLTAFIVIT